MSLSSEIGVRSDPLKGYNFVVSLLNSSSTLALVGSALLSAVTDVVVGGFSECTGLEMSLEIQEHKEGGNNGAPLLFPSTVKWAPLVLKRGVGSGTALWDWHYGFVSGTGKRRDVLITLHDDLHLPVHVWYARRGLPSRYTGPSLMAGQSQVAIESIEIKHEGIYQVPYIGLAAGAVSGAISLGSGA